MKSKIKRSKFVTKTLTNIAIASVISITGVSQSIDALLDKLVAKGVITTEEAEQLRKEQAKSQDQQKDKIKILPNVSSLRIGGELGGRIDHITVDTDSYPDRFRPRYRLRLGASADLLENITVEARIASGDAGRSPLASGYTTFEDNAAKKYIWIDRAYAKWTPINNPTFNANLTIGKMVNPYSFSWVVFDHDYSPEGIATTLSYKITEGHNLGLTAGAFMLDEISLSSHDPYLLGAQLSWKAQWSASFSTELKAAIMGIGNKEGLDNGAVPNVNVGNTRTAAGTLAYNINPFILGGGFTYLVSGVPLYPGKLPLSVDGEFIHNPAASSNKDGWDIGLSIGKASKKGTWSLEYRYFWLEADAWYEEFINDDSLAYYQRALIGSGRGAGVYGGTNQRGHLLSLTYALTDWISLAARCYINKLIDPPAGAANPTTYHLQVDTVIRF